MNAAKPTIRAMLACMGAVLFAFSVGAGAKDFAYLENHDPFYVHRDFPKLTTPQWVGEAGVDAVVILAIDDMRDPARYEAYLRPLLDRLSRIDGRSPVSIFCNAIDPQHPQLQTWLQAGLSLEVHTLHHPCPLLQRGDFAAARNTYHGCVELLNQVPGNRPVAFRMPCCDSMNSPSPRFYFEIFNRTNGAGQFLTIDSSVMHVFTTNDATVAAQLARDPAGRGQFGKYIPFPSFVTVIEDYPYPYVIGNTGWEFPAMVPSDWEAQNRHGTNNPATVTDWKLALDATVRKQGTFNFIFHPHGWIRPEQLVEFVDYAQAQYGARVKFLTFREAEARLNRFLLSDQPLRTTAGADNGARLLDLNRDGFLDVVIGNSAVRRTRVWNPAARRWDEGDFPVVLTEGRFARFGIAGTPARPLVLARDAAAGGAWQFGDGRWQARPELLSGLRGANGPIITSGQGIDQGVRFRDIDADGTDELIVAGPRERGIFAWKPEENAWRKSNLALPPVARFVDETGADDGLRFADLNEDGFDDLLFANPQAYGVYVYVAQPKPNLGWERGWSYETLGGKSDGTNGLPLIVRSGEFRNNGAWLRARHLWIQNEDTAQLPDKVDRRSFAELFTGSESKPKTVAEALTAFQLPEGFVIEAVASEPLVVDPVAFAWAADGALWVAEMHDYPSGIDGRGKPGGKIKLLRDTDGDGRYDDAQLFLDEVRFPNGIMPWRGGVLISAAPEIFYAEDRDGDGRADLRRTILTGFNEGNQQHRVNGFELGLDNWVYAANGDSSGTIRSVLTDKTADIRGFDLRFNPDTGAWEKVAGQTQFGRHRDDFGNWFGNNNPNWLWHYHLPTEYLARNPALAVANVRRLLARYPENSRVYPVSQPQRRFNWPDMVNHVTSANSAAPYRDSLFGANFSSSVFVSEPAHNVVHREVLEPDGVSFTSRRAEGEATREFLASTDNWFRPTMLKTGPDGALYVADMYRLVLEHPEYFPDEAKRRPDLRAGDDRGRIYRIYPRGARLRAIPRLDRLEAPGLVRALESTNGWERDTAHRLLLHQRPAEAPRALGDLAAKSRFPVARVHALCLLEGLNALTAAHVARALADPQPAVREHAVRLSEPFLRPSVAQAARTSADDLGRLERALLQAVDDPALRVRYQLAFTLGEWTRPAAADALVGLAARDGGNEAIRIAVLSSARPHLTTLVEGLNETTAPPELFGPLLGLAVTQNKRDAADSGFLRFNRTNETGRLPWQIKTAAEFFVALDRQDINWKSSPAIGTPKLPPGAAAFDRWLAHAPLFAVGDSALPEDLRVLAASLVGRSGAGTAHIQRLASLLEPGTPSEVQKAVLRRAARMGGREAAAIILGQWQRLTPVLRAELVQLLVSRGQSEALLDAVSSNQIKRVELGPAAQQQILRLPDGRLRKKAEQIFQASESDRRRVVAEYRAAAERPRDVHAGAVLFGAHCAICHRLGEQGNNVGPNLETVSDKSIDALLTAVLDPNQAIDAAYLAYELETGSGNYLTGLVVAETPNNITVRTAGGIDEVVLRSAIKEMRASSVSLMPEGFEHILTPKDLADLIAYLRGE